MYVFLLLDSRICISSIDILGDEISNNNNVIFCYSCISIFYDFIYIF